MALGFDGMVKHFARLTAVLVVALGASACSTIPDWVDPTTWIGDSSPPSDEQVADNGETPDLADLPDRPAASSTPDEQKQVAESLAADRTRAKYSSDALRGGTEAAAPPPSAAPSSDEIAAIRSAKRAAAPTQRSNPDEDAPPAVPITPVTQANATAPSGPPAGAQPALPLTSNAQTNAFVQPSDAALGFKASAAPPLDASLAQFVAPSIITHYQQTASNAGLAARLGPTIASGSSLKPSKLTRTASSRASHSDVAMGGPEVMTGAVVANLDALQATSLTRASVYSDSRGLPPAAVVFFPGDGTMLSAQARAQVRTAVEAFQARGAKGYVRIVGHSSSRTPNMPVERHLVVIFEKSQDRANAVAREVIREGVPADKVLVEAVGDSQPVYYESMPSGEAGNRRAEIFLQG